jgi:diguanylate cyclase (GGDEF)-like protein/PAS domain S-box-containing protein
MLDNMSEVQAPEFPFAQKLIDSLPLGVVLQDGRGSIVRINAAAEKILGLSFTQMQGLTSDHPRWRAVHDDGSSFSGAEHPAMVALRTGQPVNDVVMGVFNPRQDVYTWIRVDAFPIKGSLDQVSFVYSIFKDISERREALALRKSSELQFKSLFSSMSEGMALHRLIRDEHGTPVDYLILDANPAYEAQTGIDRSKVIGKLATQAYSQLRAPYLETYAQVAITRVPASFETYFAPLDKHFRVSVYSPEPEQFATVFEDFTATKRFYEALRLQSEITSNAALGIALVRENGELHYVNKRFEGLFGYDTGELQGCHISVINAPTTISPEETAATIIATVKAFGVWSGEVLNRKKNGTTLWTEASVSAYDDPELGQVQIVYQADITERRRAIALIEQYETVFEHAGWGMVIVDAQTNSITRVNFAYAQTHGYTKDELLGCNVFDNYPPEIRDQVMEYLEIVHKAGFHRFESMHLRKDGTRFPCQIDVSAFRDDTGKVTFLAATIEDITERRRVEDALRFSEQRYRLLAENSHDVIWNFDLQSRTFTYVSPSVERMRGFTPAEVIARPIEDWLTPHSAVTVDIALKTMLDRIAAGERSDLVQVREVDQPHRDGHIVNTEVVTTFLLDDAGRPMSILGVSRDISERRRAQEEHQLAAMVYKASTEAMVVTDANNLIESVNPAFETITGYTLEEVKGKDPKILSAGIHEPDFYAGMWHDLNVTGSWQGEVWNRRKDGKLYLEQLSINTTYSEDGSVHRRVALFSDITKKKEAADLIWRQANFDLLTDLPNRRMFRDRLEQEIKKAHRATHQLAILFIDLDHFKEVNDTLGHVKGDLLIVEAARRIVDCVRETDTVARMGGDEFTVLLADLEEVESIERAASTILRELALPFQLDDSVVYISASIGITIYPNDSTAIDDLLKNADQAMYAAKKAGRNRYRYFTQNLQENAQSRLRLISDLRLAARGGQLRVFFQPIVEMRTGKIYKAEALVRWQRPGQGLVGPGEFIVAAEETGLISEIGDWVLRESARWTQRWMTLTDAQFQTSVNRSPVEFVKDRSTEAWLDHLNDIGLPTRNIVVEVTEGILIDTESPALANLLRCRAGGIEIAIDDFGTGYSSLSYLKKFDIDYLKIDQSFTRNLAAATKDLALSTAIIAMAHALGLKVIAEGVETAEQRDLLLAAGCDYGQGYFYSKPVPPEEFEGILLRDDDTTR